MAFPVRTLFQIVSVPRGDRFSHAYHPDRHHPPQTHHPDRARQTGNSLQHVLQVSTQTQGHHQHRPTPIAPIDHFFWFSCCFEEILLKMNPDAPSPRGLTPPRQILDPLTQVYKGKHQECGKLV